ncbi:uncharacterized protein [Pseudorasbora parva]|uniref:uncharacterized protein n=1 Tax=Pseudorasbora parva TaxID=51549 RepID=UPI00351E42C0
MRTSAYDVDSDIVSVSVMEGDSVTLHTGVETNQQDRMTWYFNNTRIAQITGNKSKICADDQCTERFRDRLKLDHQTGSLTIMNIRNTDAGEYQIQTINRRIIQKIFNVVILEKNKLKMKSVKEGESVTLDPAVMKNTNDSMMWYFNDVLIAEITEDQSQICSDDQCKERFRDRLKLDHQTGALTITNINTTDAGEYNLKINSNRIISNRKFSIRSSGVETDGVSVSVKEGDSVTLYTDVELNQLDRMKWYFNDIRIAQITGDQSKVCTDVQCNEGTERFRDRLKLDHQTGSLTITHTTTEDSGDYKLQFIRRRIIQKIFNVGVSAAERDEVKRKSVKEGKSVTLDPGEMKNTNNVMTWYFTDVLIAEITGDQSQICTDDQCKERFRDRLKLDHQTGSLTITHTTNTDSGEYKLQIVQSIRLRHSISIISIKRFIITVINSSLPLGLTAGICAAVSVAVALVAAIVIGCKFYCRQNKKRPPSNIHPGMI